MFVCTSVFVSKSLCVNVQMSMLSVNVSAQASVDVDINVAVQRNATENAFELANVYAHKHFQNIMMTMTLKEVRPTIVRGLALQA